MSQTCSLLVPLPCVSIVIHTYTLLVTGLPKCFTQLSLVQLCEDECIEEYDVDCSSVDSLTSRSVQTPTQRSLYFSFYNTISLILPINIFLLFHESLRPLSINEFWVFLPILSKVQYPLFFTFQKGCLRVSAPLTVNESCVFFQHSQRFNIHPFFTFQGVEFLECTKKLWGILFLLKQA